MIIMFTMNQMACILFLCLFMCFLIRKNENFIVELFNISSSCLYLIINYIIWWFILCNSTWQDGDVLYNYCPEIIVLSTVIGFIFIFYIVYSLMLVLRSKIYTRIQKIIFMFISTILLFCMVLSTATPFTFQYSLDKYMTNKQNK
jgi:hypothetical protein